MVPDFLQSVFGWEGLIIGTLVPFFFVLLVVVFIHEMGHYLVGRWCGIAATDFSLGFGPEIAGFTDGNGTRWKLSAIPLGGYVKFLGDMTVTSSEAVSESELTEEQRRRAFHTQAVWKRILTVAAGPVANFLLTILIFSLFFGLYGRVIVAPTVGEVRPDSPAAVAGFEPGDRIVGMDGRQVESFADIQRYVSGRSDRSITFDVERGDREIELTATPAYTEHTDPLGNTVRIGIIGITSGSEEEGSIQREDLSPVDAFTTAVSETGFVIVRTGEFLQRLVAGREDRCQLGGPVKIADMAGKAAQKGFSWLVQLLALLSVGIGILNLLPIPPLDGGHLVFYAAEAIRGRPLSERILDYAYRVGFVAVLAFTGFVFYNDIFAC